MTIEQDQKAEPTRLSEEGGAYSVLGELGQQGMSAGRLAASRQGLEAQIALIAKSTSSGGLAGAGLSGSSKVVIGLLVIALGITGAWWLTREPAHELKLAPAIVTRNAPVRRPETKQRILLPIATIDAGAMDMKSVQVYDDAQAQIAKPSQPSQHSKSSSTVPRALPTLAPSKEKGSDLPAQIALLEQARQHTRASRHEQALAVLAELASKYPNSPLLAEADVSRAESLAMSGDVDAATKLIGRLLQSPLHSGRRAQLSHLLADVWLRAGDCQKAVPAYQAALRFGLATKRAAAAQRGLAQCNAREASEKQN